MINFRPYFESLEFSRTKCNAIFTTLSCLLEQGLYDEINILRSPKSIKERLKSSLYPLSLQETDKGFDWTIKRIPHFLILWRQKNNRTSRINEDLTKQGIEGAKIFQLRNPRNFKLETKNKKIFKIERIIRLDAQFFRCQSQCSYKCDWEHTFRGCILC